MSRSRPTTSATVPVTSSALEFRRNIVPLSGATGDYDDLLDLVGDRRVVLLGEATHGTHEFYSERARITKRLIEEKGFNAVAVEADWPDAYRVNRYVMGQSSDRDAAAALADLDRFPAWMWRNRVVAGFIEWLRARNDVQHDQRTKVRFYGLDLYSMRRSMEAVIGYLDTIDAGAAADARRRYSCIDHVPPEGALGEQSSFALELPCEDEVVGQLVELRQSSSELLAHGGWIAEDEYFYAEQNARLVLNADKYYRHLYRAEVSWWNIRDRHMVGTLEALAAHLDEQLGQHKLIVWAHNSHIGDARATQMGSHGKVNMGHLVRMRWGQDSALVGFTTDHGEVTAASEWGGAAERKQLCPAPLDSFERMFHDSGPERFWLSMRGTSDSVLGRSRLERAIGVVYSPDLEQTSHWFHADLTRQFDAVIHIDGTTPVEPLERTVRWDEGEPPETYPTGL